VVLHYVTHVGVKGRPTGFWMLNLKERDSLNDLGIDDDDDFKEMRLLSNGFMFFSIGICGCNSYEW
jgi:hypothetical protein